jgi:hypothetical protein
VTVLQTSDNCGLDNVVHDWDYGPAPIGDTYVTWTAFDVQGNSSTCTQQIHVEDLIAPIIICPEPMNFVIPDGALVAEVIMGIPQVMDNCGGVSITNNITESDNASGNYPIGNTDVVFTALDDAGNVSTCISSVDVSVQTVTCCPGDFNCDGYVSVLDLIILINEFGCISGCAASLDGNTTTTVSDLEIFVGLYGTVCPE